MVDDIRRCAHELSEGMLRFASDLVRIKSFTGGEEAIVRRIKAEMEALGYDEVGIDAMGNLVGRVGSGARTILFDSHVDTVGVTDAPRWTHDPFGGHIVEGRLYGRGSVDMKSAVAASVYAGRALKRLGLLAGRTVLVSTSVMEEDYDGESLVHELGEGGLRPEAVVICEPSDCTVSLGQKGRALLRIDMPGGSAHGSAPEKGDNPVYRMKAVIARIEELGLRLMEGHGEGGSIALTSISCETASLNAIPASCTAYVDRRLVKGQDEAAIAREMDGIVAGTPAKWEVHRVVGKSWTDRTVVLESFLPAWELEASSPLGLASIGVWEELFPGKARLSKWDFSTNGVASARLGIPTIGFGPGDSKQAHCVDEHCPVEQIVKALEFYTALAARF